MEAVRLLATGQSYRQIEESVGIPKSTLSGWVNSKQEFREALEQARRELWIAHQGILDSYREALRSATQATPRCVEILLQLAESEDVRTTDRIKCIEVILSKSGELMRIVNDGDIFPEVGLAEADKRAEEEQRLKRKLAIAGWIEAGNGVWSPPNSLGQCYSLLEAYQIVAERN